MNFCPRKELHKAEGNDIRGRETKGRRRGTHKHECVSGAAFSLMQSLSVTPYGSCLGGGMKTQMARTINFTATCPVQIHNNTNLRGTTVSKKTQLLLSASLITKKCYNDINPITNKPYGVKMNETHFQIPGFRSYILILVL